MTNIFLLFILPFLSAFIILALSFFSKGIVKGLSFFLSLIPLTLLVFGNTQWIGEEINIPWLSALSIHFHLKIDSISYLFLLLVNILVPLCIASTKERELSSSSTLYIFIFILQGLLIGFFTARDMVLFTFFWEAMLIPLFFIMNLWGGPQRHQAAMKFLIYMIAGSTLMIAAVLGLYLTSTDSGMATFDLDKLQNISRINPYAMWIFAIFCLAFAVKTPLFPFHAWLPDAYCEASLQGTILLSALLSKAGIYGFLRIGIEIFPTAMNLWRPLLLTLSIAGVLYGALAAWKETDFKRILAYSSFSHVNFILAGIFALQDSSHTGAILQAVNHGITIAALFFVAGWLEERIGTRSINGFHGLAKFMPTLCWLTLFFVLSSIALPGLNNFIGEFLILFGLFEFNPWLAALLGVSTIFSLLYMLRWFQRLYFGPPGFYQNNWIDIRKEEVLIASPLIALILWIGIYPNPLLKLIERG